MLAHVPQAYHLTNEFLIKQGVMPEIDLSSRVRRGASSSAGGRRGNSGADTPGESGQPGGGGRSGSGGFAGSGNPAGGTAAATDMTAAATQRRRYGGRSVQAATGYGGQGPQGYRRGGQSGQPGRATRLRAQAAAA